MALPTDDHDVVRAAFVQWVSAQPAAPRDAASLIEHVEISHDYAGLLDTDVRGRRLVWKSVPAASRTRITTPATSADFDVWTVDPLALREGTIHIAVCHGCAGEKRVPCSACNATGKTICGACHGQRKAYGYASNGSYRLLNCTACRGKGEIDCRHCRRGIATCPTCAGEGRLQRWMEIESWQRSAFRLHPQSFVGDFGWQESPANDAVARDAELHAEVDRPHQLTHADIGGISEEWLSVLRPDITADERIARQCLRIARIPTRQVYYRIGNDGGRVAFSGRRFVARTSVSDDAFARRATRLRALKVVLIAIAIVLITASLVRGTFFLSVPTLLSLLACCAGLICIHAAAADWTGARRRTRVWVIAAATSLGIAIILAIAALPRLEHARGLIAAGRLDAAESELRALGGDASPPAWADLRLERVRRSTDVGAARNTMGEIPSTLPQHALASDAVDQLILATARDDARTRHLPEASAALSFLSDRARGRPDAIAVAEEVCVASASEDIRRRDWSGAAQAIVAARRIGVGTAKLEPFQDAIRTAAVDAAESARRREEARERLRQRLTAEATFVAWESSAERWGTPQLIALRTAMARDVAAVEHAEKRKGRKGDR